MLAISILAVAACGGTCPEVTAEFVPSDLNLTDRSYVESGAGATAMRAQWLGPGSRELTLLSGVAGEIPLGRDTGTRQTVRGHEAPIYSPSADTRVARWLEGPEGDPCSQYAVIASGLSAAEFENVLNALR